MRLNGVKVEILINGQLVTEHDDSGLTQSSVSEVSRYIEAVTDANFEIRCTVEPSFVFAPAIDYLSFEFEIDGNGARGKAIPKADGLAERPMTRTRSGFVVCRGGKQMEERFRFRRINTIEGHISAEEVTHQQRQLEKVGTIMVMVFRKVQTSDAFEKSFKSCSSGTLDHYSRVLVHEKTIALGAVELGVSKDEPTPYRDLPRWEGRSADLGPIAIFKFKYRSRLALQQLGIIPRSPRPTPLEDRDPDTLTDEEMRELLKILKAREKENKVKIKQEAREANLRQLKVQGKRRANHDDEDEDGVVEEVAQPKKKIRVELVDLRDYKDAAMPNSVCLHTLRVLEKKERAED